MLNGAVCRSPPNAGFRAECSSRKDEEGTVFELLSAHRLFAALTRLVLVQLVTAAVAREDGAVKHCRDCPASELSRRRDAKEGELCCTMMCRAAER